MNKALYIKTFHHAQELYSIIHNNTLSQQLMLTRQQRIELSDMLSELSINTQIIMDDDVPDNLTSEDYEAASYHG